MADNIEDPRQLLIEKMNLQNAQLKEIIEGLKQGREVAEYGGARPGTPASYAQWNEVSRQGRIGNEIQDISGRIRELERPTENIPREATWGREGTQAVGPSNRVLRTPEGGYTNIPGLTGPQTDFTRFTPGLSRAQMDTGAEDELKDLLQRKDALEMQLRGEGGTSVRGAGLFSVRKEPVVKPGWQPAQIDEAGDVWQVGPTGQMIRRAAGIAEKVDLHPLDREDYNRASMRQGQIDTMLATGTDPASGMSFTADQRAALQTERDTLDMAKTKIRERTGKAIPATGRPGAAGQAQPEVVRYGTDKKTGKRVVQLADGTVTYVQ